jgi:hypothetical protein
MEAVVVWTVLLLILSALSAIVGFVLHVLRDTGLVLPEIHVKSVQPLVPHALPINVSLVLLVMA